MSIPFSARLVDLVNLVVAKGGNFLLAILVFGVMSRSMNESSFSEFGYWWSIALMVGGVLFGGISATLIRLVSIHGSLLSHVRSLLTSLAIGLLLLGGLGIIVILWLGYDFEATCLLLAVGGFGVAMQFQAMLLSLLRAACATAATIRASVAWVISVPLCLWTFSFQETDLSRIFLWMALAMAIGFGVAAWVSGPSLWRLFSTQPSSSGSQESLVRNTASFVAVNFFSFAFVNIDFTLFREIGTASEYSAMAAVKIFFERFALPLMLVFSGAVSMRVLRQPDGGAGGQRGINISIRRNLYSVFTLIALIIGLTVAYQVLTPLFTQREVALTPVLSGIVVAGYVLYMLNGVFWDVLVLRKSTRGILWRTSGLLIGYAFLQYFSIRNYGISGWAIGWFLANLVVTLVLLRGGVIAYRMREGAMPSKISS